MKGKKGTYLLLVLVCAIWVGIGIEIVNAFSEKGKPIAVVDLPAISRKIKKIEKKKFTVQAIDRDPFLGTFRKKKIVRKNVKKNKKSKIVIQWPRIKYKGTIADNNENTAIFLVEVNGVVQLMRKGSSRLELILINGNKSSITLLYQKERKEFKIIN